MCEEHVKSWMNIIATVPSAAVCARSCLDRQQA